MTIHTHPATPPSLGSTSKSARDFLLDDHGVDGAHEGVLQLDIPHDPNGQICRESGLLYPISREIARERFHIYGGIVPNPPEGIVGENEVADFYAAHRKQGADGGYCESCQGGHGCVWVN